MTPRDWFGLVLRTVGLLLTLVGAGCLLIVLGLSFFNPMIAGPGMPSDVIPPLLFSSGFIAVGVYLLRSAPGLIDFSYPERGPVS